MLNGILNIGERIIVPSNQTMATVVGTGSTHLPNGNTTWQYSIRWDHVKYDQNYTSDTYEHELVKDIWQLLTTHIPARGFYYQSPKTISQEAAAIINFTPETFCSVYDHDWSTYNGFRESYDFCKKCDKKKHD